MICVTFLQTSIRLVAASLDRFAEFSLILDFLDLAFRWTNKKPVVVGARALHALLASLDALVLAFFAFTLINSRQREVRSTHAEK
jgi:predicted Kef-type K+ transport protein